jgi:hypothetical protein
LDAEMLAQQQELLNPSYKNVLMGDGLIPLWCQG